MKKLLAIIFMLTATIIVVLNNKGALNKNTFGADKQNIVSSRPAMLEYVHSADDYIYCTDKMDSGAKCTSIYSSDYDKLKTFIKSYNLELVDSYVVDGVIVKEYISNWFAYVGNSNFQVADYGDSYIVGYPYIYEGFWCIKH